MCTIHSNKTAYAAKTNLLENGPFSHILSHISVHSFNYSTRCIGVLLIYCTCYTLDVWVSWIISAPLTTTSLLFPVSVELRITKDSHIPTGSKRSGFNSRTDWRLTFPHTQEWMLFHSLVCVYLVFPLATRWVHSGCSHHHPWDRQSVDTEDILSLS